jgi:hypothetical protein
MNGAKEARRAKEWGKGLYHRLSGNYEVVNNLAQYYSTGNFRIGDITGQSLPILRCVKVCTLRGRSG